MFNVFIDIEEKHDWEAFVGRPSIALVYYLFNAHYVLYKLKCKTHKFISYVTLLGVFLLLF